MNNKTRYLWKGEWYYIDFIKDNLGMKFKEYENRAKTTVLEFFTGLYDKNGAEIYKGDILKTSSDTKIRISDGVEFKDPSWKIFTIGYIAPSFNCTIVAQYNYFFGELPATRSINTFGLEITEVIGNIHQNSDLLE